MRRPPRGCNLRTGRLGRRSHGASGEMISGARDVVSVKRVYGEPYEKNGLTVIPAATVHGGGGAAWGTTRKVSRAAAAAVSG